MARKSGRPRLKISASDLSFLEEIRSSRSRERRETERATIILMYQEGAEIQEIAKRVGLSRPSVYRCLDRAAEVGVREALKDLPRASGKRTITPEAKAWVTSLACAKPKDFGLASELWTRQSLSDYVRVHAEEAGHPCLKKSWKGTAHRLLMENGLHPERVKYYLEKRDPEFDKKMAEVLLVYREVFLEGEKGAGADAKVVTVCVDEKPGVQALANTAPDLPPVPGKHASVARDHEYVRHGTASILAGIDLRDGRVFAQVHRRHRSVEFIELLKEMDEHYPKDVQIRTVLDNHSSHISKETRKFLATKPGRFVYVHTPKHGSWLNLAETLFGKMARTFLKHIRVASWEELKERILKGVREINEHPVVHRWKKFESLMTEPVEAGAN